MPEAEPITDMTFSLDEATTTATLTSYTGSGGIVKIPETVGIGKQKTKDFGPYANVNELINEFSSSEKGLLDVYLIGDISYTSENEQKVDENQMIAFWAMNNENAEYANIEIKCKDRHTLKVSASDMENDVGVVRLYGPAAGYLVVGDQTILDTMSMSYTIRLNNEEFYIDKNAVMQSIENNPGVFADYIDLIGSLIEGGTQEIMVTFEDIVYGETVTSGTEYIVTSIGSNVFQGFDYSDFEELITNVISSSYSMRSYNNIYSLSIPSTITSIASDAFVGTLPLVELFNYSNLDVVSYLVSEPDYVYTSSDIDGDTAPQSKVIILDNVYYLQNDDGLTALGLVDPYITEVHLNSRTTTINQGAFMGCNMIQDFYIPKTVTTVEDYGLFCFIRRPHIESISTWATMNFAMPEYSFNRFPAIAILWIALVGQNPNEIEYIDDLAENLIIDLYYNSSPLSGDLVFEENIQYIRPLAFWGCMSLTSVTIPSSVTSIGADAFSSCYALAEVYNYSTHIGDVTIGSSTNGLLGQYAKVVYNPSDLTGGKPGTRIKTINNVQYYKDGEDFIALAPSVARGSLTTLTLDSSTTEINSHAFYNYSNLTSIEIPSSVTSIGDSAFYNCSALETVTFKDTTTEWTVTRDSTSKTITSQELQSPNTMATYLRSDYYNYTWTKKQSA